MVPGCCESVACPAQGPASDSLVLGMSEKTVQVTARLCPAQSRTESPLGGFTDVVVSCMGISFLCFFQPCGVLLPSGLLGLVLFHLSHERWMGTLGSPSWFLSGFIHLLCVKRCFFPLPSA